MIDKEDERLARLEHEVEFLRSALFEADEQISRLIEKLDALVGQKDAK